MLYAPGDHVRAQASTKTLATTVVHGVITVQNDKMYIDTGSGIRVDLGACSNVEVTRPAYDDILGRLVDTPEGRGRVVRVAATNVFVRVDDAEHLYPVEGLTIVEEGEFQVVVVFKRDFSHDLFAGPPGDDERQRMSASLLRELGAAREAGFLTGTYTAAAVSITDDQRTHL